MTKARAVKTIALKAAVKDEGLLYTPIVIKITGYKNPIRLGSLLIRKLSQKEKIDFLNIKKIKIDDIGRVTSFQPAGKNDPYLFAMSHSDSLRMKSAEYVIVTNGKHDEASKNVSNLLLALRLNKSGKVVAPMMMSKDKWVFRFLHPMFIKDSHIYEISIKELRKIKKTIRVIEINLNKLDAVIDRFNNAINYKTNWKNSFIDLITILESILLEDSKELSFRFSLYLSFLLTDELEMPTRFKDIKKAYDIRSELVHSGKSKKYNSKLFEEILDYTRKIIVWKFSSDKTKIDKLILDKLKIS